MSLEEQGTVGDYSHRPAHVWHDLTWSCGPSRRTENKKRSLIEKENRGNEGKRKEEMEGDQWAFLAKGIPLHWQIGLDSNHACSQKSIIPSFMCGWSCLSTAVSLLVSPFQVREAYMPPSQPMVYAVWQRKDKLDVAFSPQIISTSEKPFFNQISSTIGSWLVLMVQGW